jgi:Protein of unknown function (DUF2721)
VDQQAAVATVGHAIQLSVAPVFLLSAIAGMLAVLTNRLARVVDAARALEAVLVNAPPANPARLHGNLATFARRAMLINVAITFCTITAILVCGVVATLFFAAFLKVDVSALIATLFVIGMSTFILGLLYFLREIFLATATLRIGPH